MSAPKPCMTNPTPTRSSIRPPLSLQFNVRFRWLIYLRQKSFYLLYGKHCSRGIQSVRMRPAKGNIHKCIQLYFIPEFRVTTRPTILGDITFTAKMRSIYGYIIKLIENIKRKINSKEKRLYKMFPWSLIFKPVNSVGPSTT